MTSYLRPDEMATESDIRKSQGRTGAIKSGLETVASAGTYGLASKAAMKILPFLSEYIPADLALKGINKVMPGVGTFLKNGMKQGLTLKSGLDFLKDELTKTEPAKQNENTNIIQQVSPELHQFIDEQLKRGRSPLEAGAIAQNDKRFSDAISKLTKAHKSPWSSILQTVYGVQNPQQQNQGATESAAPQQPGQQPQQGGQPGPGQQALMDILQKIQQAKGGQGQ
jgi:hypothetical protein